MTTSICGLDVASTSAAVCIQNPDGSLLHEITLPATRAGEDRLLTLLPGGAQVFMESHRIAAAGHPGYVLNALLAKRLMGAANARRPK